MGFKICSPEFYTQFFNKCSAFCLLRTLVPEIGLQQVCDSKDLLKTIYLGLHADHLVQVRTRGYAVWEKKERNVVFGTEL